MGKKKKKKWTHFNPTHSDGQNHFGKCIAEWQNKFFQQIVINKGIKNAKDESFQGFVIHTTDFWIKSKGTPN